MSDVTPERIAVMAAAARIPLLEGAPVRIAGAVRSTVKRLAAENLALPLETEPSSFLLAQHKDAGR